MPESFPCPYLEAAVECTDERHSHVLYKHSDFAPAHWGRAAETLLDPDQVRASKRDAGVILFFRWYPDVGKYVVVAVNMENPTRRWLITAHFARKSDGDLLWTKS